MNDQFQYASPSSLTPMLSPADREVAYFTAPVRCGRRRHDAVGHLEVTSQRLRFHGAVDVNIAWAEVSAIEALERDVIVHVRERRRQFRFCFQTVEEAGQGFAVARQLAAAAAT